MIFEVKLAEMLCTRLCHDLTGPIGAVNNGAEFLGDEGFDMQHEAMQLILSSAHEAVSRLQFYRQAYGRVSDSGEACLGDKKQLATAFFAATKVKLDWPDSHTDAAGVSLSQKTSRLLLNALVVVGASLIKGGTLSVRLSNQNELKEIQLLAEGAIIKCDAETQAILTGNADEKLLSPKTAQLFLTAKLAQEVGATVSLDVQSDRLSFVMKQKQVLFATAAH